MGGFDAMQNWPVASYVYAGLAGLMHFVIGRNSNYHSMRALGSTLSTPIQQVSTIMSLFLAVVVLKESFSGLNIVGIGLVMVGPAMLIGRRKSIAAAATGQRFIPDMKTGMIHGAVCVVGYGSSPVLIVLALAAVENPADRIAHSTAILFLSYLCAAGGVAVMVAFTGGVAAVVHSQKWDELVFTVGVHDCDITDIPLRRAGLCAGRASCSYSALVGDFPVAVQPADQSRL